MSKKTSLVLVVVTPIHLIGQIKLYKSSDSIILISKTAQVISYKKYQYHELDNVKPILRAFAIIDLWLLSKADGFDAMKIKKYIAGFYKVNRVTELIVLLPFKKAPKLGYRIDDFCKSLMVSAKKAGSIFSRHGSGDLSTIVYNVVKRYLNSQSGPHIEVVQIGKQDEDRKHAEIPNTELRKSMLVIPHKGAIRLLNRCLYYLNAAKDVPAEINVCFDDLSYKELNKENYKTLHSALCMYRNEPGNVGPYLPRHNSILNTNKEYVFFQDSDDISLRSRFVKQLKEIRARGLDIVGSHELRIDEFEKKILIVRFALDGNRSLKFGHFHPVLHPTCLITREAYLKSGGLSTDRKFGNDSQFILRAFYSMKIGNIDEFLYFRFKRPHSLTTNIKTRLGGPLRAFLLKRWHLDFGFIRKGKLELSESSLQQVDSNFPYKLIKL